MRGPIETLYDKSFRGEGEPLLKDHIQNANEWEAIEAQGLGALIGVTGGVITALSLPNALTLDDDLTITNTETGQSHISETYVNRAFDTLDIAGALAMFVLTLEGIRLWHRGHKRSRELKSS